MIFIVGWGHQIKKTVGPVHERTCDRCYNSKHWILEKTTSWTTLFFIPVIPGSTKHYLYCPVCKNGEDISKEAFEGLVPLAKLNQEAIDKNMSEEEYEERLNNINYGKTF